VKPACIFLAAFLQASMNLASASQELACPASAQSVRQGIQMPSAVVGRHYARPVVQGGEPPYTFTFESGSPEDIGLSLNAQGLLSGTPVRPGIHSFTVAVQNGGGCPPLRQTFRIRVLASPVGEVGEGVDGDGR
jgi:hypothetical protein